MKTGEVCNRTVIVAGRDTPLGDAARLMRENHVGSLVVVDDLLEIVAEQLDDIVRAIGNEQSREASQRP